MHKDKTPIFFSKFSSRSFTLIEIIIVIIIVGILAAVGITQYALMVERGRTAEARLHIDTMRTLAHQYWLENSDMTNIRNADVGVDNTCRSTDFYKYYVNPATNWVELVAFRCASGGKTPNASRQYDIWLRYYPATGQSDWNCQYVDDMSFCSNLL
ncbi:prepilin-type N-terminal cleavage/methylation domain-containing protein [bacterium]|nr:MAG: prepilin-type N-terminal cleavage/methylation domain-containing protein [bacterium]